MENIIRLHCAIDSNEEATIKALIEDGVDVNIIYNRETAFTHAIQSEEADLTLKTILQSETFNVNASNQFKRSPLYYAAKTEDHADLVSYLISLGADVNARDVMGVSPLAATCWHDNADVASCIVDSGADVNILDKDGSTPLIQACSNTSTRVATILLEAGCDLNHKTTSGVTALIAALPSSYKIDVSKKKLSDIIDLMRKLIRHGSDVNQVDHQGNTALHLAVEQDQLHATCVLMQNKCNLYTRNESGMTAFDLAINPGKPLYRIAICIILHGCDIFRLTREETQSTTRIGLLSNFLRESILSSSHLTTEGFLLRDLIMNELEESQFYTNLSNIFKSNQLNYPVRLTRLCRGVIRRCMDVSMLTNISNLYLPNALSKFVTYGMCSNLTEIEKLFDIHTAVGEGDLTTVDELLTENNLNYAIFGRTLLETAVESGDAKMVETLIKCGTNISARNLERDTMLHVAARSGSEDIVKLLLEEGCKLHLENRRGNLALHEACKFGNLHLLKHLVTNEVESGNVCDYEGFYPLHYACANAHVESVKLLVENKVALDVVDKFGFTALHVCASRGCLYLKENIPLPGLFDSELVMNLVTTKIMYCENYTFEESLDIRFLCIVKELINAGCNVDAFTPSGQTAFDVASLFLFQSCIAVLEEH